MSSFDKFIDIKFRYKDIHQTEESRRIEKRMKTKIVRINSDTTLIQHVPIFQRTIERINLFSFFYFLQEIFTWILLLNPSKTTTSRFRFFYLFFTLTVYRITLQIKNYLFYSIRFYNLLIFYYILRTMEWLQMMVMLKIRNFKN